MVVISIVTMHSTTAGLNVLPTRLIPHGTAMTNTMRQVAASIGTATLVTVMSLAALDTKGVPNPEAVIHGVNIAFYVANGITIGGLILAFFVRGRYRVNEQEEVE